MRPVPWSPHAQEMRPLVHGQGEQPANLVVEFPVSELYRITNDEQGLQLDFMAKLHGVGSFEGLRSRAVAVDFGGNKLIVASLADVIKSKRATGRDRDKAVLDILQRTLDCALTFPFQRVERGSVICVLFHLAKDLCHFR
jgi:hypothetical protein